MKFGESLIVAAALVGSACGQALSQAGTHPNKTTPQLSQSDRALAHDIFRELIETNTTHSKGNTSAAEEMRARLLAAGFAPADVVIAGPNPRKQNIVARLHGKAGSGNKPVLIIGHLDVVEARPEDWTPGLDPFKLTEKGGYFYGRGTQDMKDSDAAAVVSLIRMKREGFVPDRDIILALTADEEGGGDANGVDWLLKNRRELVQAGFALNPDSGGLLLENGKPVSLGVEATEKLYADYHVTATNPGGHSSLPTGNNAIYHVADALGRLQQYRFPFELNEVTRAYFTKMSGIERKSGHAVVADDMSKMLANPADTAAADRLAQNPERNALMRTTCVATTMEAGDAPNALPARALANVNCRIFPGHSQEEIRQQLIHIFADPTLKVDYVNDEGQVLGKGSDKASMKPPPLNPVVFHALDRTVAEMWPGVPVVPEMEAGASDSIYTMAAGIPSYGFSGMGIEQGDDRAHGKDERIGIEPFYQGVEFYYLYLKNLTSSPTGQQ